MKKTILILFAFLCLFCCTGCGRAPAQETQPVQPAQPDQTQEPAVPEEESDNWSEEDEIFVFRKVIDPSN